MRTESPQTACSFSNWYPLLRKYALEAAVLPIPEDVREYLENGAFVLPRESTSSGVPDNWEWSDGSTVNELQEEPDLQPTFPQFSNQVQEVIDQYQAVFIKSNWSTPSDATWVTPTKTLKCNSLEDVYLLLKSSDRISQDLAILNSSKENSLSPCLVLKKWRNIDPCTEFRCFVIKRELVGIAQRDISQYYKHIEQDKYSIQRDIKSLFMENIKNTFVAENYTFDVIRYKKDKVKIIDFGVLNESVTKGTLFTLEELKCDIVEAPEFRFIAEDMGIQPKTTTHFCIPHEINEFFQGGTGGMSVMEVIQKEVEEQGKGKEDNNKTNNS